MSSVTGKRANWESVMGMYRPLGPESEAPTNGPARFRSQRLRDSLPEV